MTFKSSPRFAVSILSLGMSLAAVLAFTQPANALPTHEELVQQVQNHWAKLEERRSFNRLSIQNFEALNSILDADELIAKHHQKEAEAKLSSAQQQLTSALQAHHILAKAASYVEKIHKVDPAIRWLPQYDTANWAPVGGKFIARTQLSSAENKAVIEANNNLRAGKVEQAYKAVGHIQTKTQISIAIAPLEPTIKAVETALSKLRNNNAASAHDVLNEAMNHYVFIPQDDLNVNVLVHRVKKNNNLLARR